MLPGEWLRMGGQDCERFHCADCIRSELYVKLLVFLLFGLDVVVLVHSSKHIRILPTRNSTNIGTSLRLPIFSVTFELISVRNTWFTQDDVNELKDLGINTVRIPVSFLRL